MTKAQQVEEILKGNSEGEKGPERREGTHSTRSSPFHGSKAPPQAGFASLSLQAHSPIKLRANSLRARRLFSVLSTQDCIPEYLCIAGTHHLQDNF